jgi:excisionase family DNA binding protein
MEQLLLKVEQVAYQLNESRATVYPKIMSGEIPSVKIGRSRRVPYAALVAYVENLPQAQP